jgi:uncharacterized SAM-binding protein YcdF (DUF218 family)
MTERTTEPRDQSLSRPRRQWITRLLALALAGLGLWLTGLAIYISSMPSEVADTATPTDAIVVLTGGSERLTVGLDLLEQGLADHLFLSGVGEEVTLDDLRGATLNIPAHLSDRVILGHAALNTVGNAHETAEWVAAMGVTSLRLVTSAYHMPRALLEFHETMPWARIIPHPVFPKAVKQEEWWKWPGTTLLLAEEYTKFLVAWARGRFARLAPASDRQ